MSNYQSTWNLKLYSTLPIKSKSRKKGLWMYFECILFTWLADVDDLAGAMQ